MWASYIGGNLVEVFLDCKLYLQPNVIVSNYVLCPREDLTSKQS